MRPPPPVATGLESLIRGREVLSLPEVTLVCVDTAWPEAALRAVRHCMQQIRFGAAVLVTRPGHGLTGVPADLTLVLEDGVRSLAAYSEYVMRRLLPLVHTSHCLVVQWDGFVIDTSAWDPGLLALDYVGSVIPHAPAGYRVGNGGFSLRSRRLLEALLDPDITQMHPEDWHIGHTYRDLLAQRYGIRHASEEQAQRFSAERHQPPGPTFGLHGIDTLYQWLPEAQFQRFAAGLPGHLLGGSGGRNIIDDALARGDVRVALQVMRERRKRRSVWSGIDLWPQVAWAVLRNMGRTRPAGPHEALKRTAV